MPDASPADPLKSELRALLSAISERAKTEEKVENEFADDGSSQRNLSAKLKSTTSKFESDKIQFAFRTNTNRPRTRCWPSSSATMLLSAPTTTRPWSKSNAPTAPRSRQPKKKKPTRAGWSRPSSMTLSHESPAFNSRPSKKAADNDPRPPPRPAGRKADATAEAASEADAESPARALVRSELDPIENPQDVQECEERFGAAIRTIREVMSLSRD